MSREGAILPSEHDDPPDRAVAAECEGRADRPLWREAGPLNRLRRTAARLVGVVLVLGLSAGALAQVPNPVYMDDSPRARDALGQIDALIAAGNQAEAVRALQRLLDDDADRVIETIEDAHLLVSVRRRVHERLLGDADMLERYRAAESERARAMLGAGESGAVERSRLLTPAGFDAALVVAREHLEAARFEAARLTLEQLETHPDRAGDAARARDASAALALVASYLDRPSLWARAERWSREASPDRRAVAWPEAAGVRSLDPTHAGPEMDPATLLPTPMRTVDLRPGRRETERPARSGRGGSLIEAPWLYPAVVGDVVYVSDGQAISAWDRFTLAPRWRVVPRGSDAAAIMDEPFTARQVRFARTVEDANVVVVADRLAIAATGMAASGGRTGDTRLHALDRRTGRVLWSVAPDALDPQLVEATVRGPAVVEGDTAVVSLRKFQQSRRVVSLYLAGLDVGTGELRWLRLLGSAGSLGFQTVGRASDWPLLHEGIVYRADELGLVAAVEAATGRVVWARRMPAIGRQGYPFTLPWATNQPVPDSETLLLIAPGRQAVVRLDRATGAMLGVRNAADLGEPDYLVRVGDRLAAVAQNQIAFVPIAEVESAAPASLRFGEDGIVGRVVVSGERLLAPVPEGVAVIDPGAPANARIVRLDASGNLLALDSQLLVLGNERLHSYLVWEEAARVLGRRMEETPDDPDPAITFAELAYRAGKPDRIIGACDAALAAIDRDPTSEANRASRERLFGVLRTMVEAASRRWFSEGAADPSRPDAPPSPRDEPVIGDLRLLEDLIGRLGRVADAPEQRVAHLLALGRLREVQNRHAVAVEVYQSVLADAALSGAAWTGPTLSVRADVEASRRVRRIATERGLGLYAPFEAEAAQRLAGAGDAGALEAIARRFPMAEAGARAWMRAAESHERAGRAPAATAALEAGIEVLEARAAAGSAPDRGLLGELAGRLVTTLVRSGRYDSAADRLAALSAKHSRLALTVGGTPVDAESLRAELLGRRESARRLAAIGATVERESVQALRGWSLLRPLVREGAHRDAGGALLASPERSAVALWTPDPNGPGLVQRWEATLSAVPTLLRMDPEAAVVYVPGDSGGTFARLSAADGAVAWQTQPVADLLAGKADGALGDDVLTETPLDGPVRYSDLLVALDEQTLAVVTRSGAVAVVDLATGRTLWTARTDAMVVHDADAGAGLLAIGGAGRRADEAAEPEPVLAVYDLRTGLLLNRIGDVVGRVRWVRVTPRGRLVAGLERGILALTPPAADFDWIATDEAAQVSAGAWTLDDRLFLLTAEGDLRLGSVSTGRLREVPLETRNRVEPTASADLAPLGDLALFGSTRGLVVFGEAARLVGADALDGSVRFIAPALGSPHSVAVETRGTPDAEGRGSTHAVMIFESQTGRLVATERVLLGAPPRRVALVEGRILITAGQTTLVLPAPVGR